MHKPGTLVPRMQTTYFNKRSVCACVRAWAKVRGHYCDHVSRDIQYTVFTEGSSIKVLASDSTWLNDPWTASSAGRFDWHTTDGAILSSSWRVIFHFENKSNEFSPFFATHRVLVMQSTYSICARGQFQFWREQRRFWFKNATAHGD